METLKVGDVVKLKSGSPDMTVSQVVIAIQTKQPNGFIKCVWFEGDTKRNGEFRVETLEKVTY